MSSSIAPSSNCPAEPRSGNTSPTSATSLTFRSFANSLSLNPKRKKPSSPPPPILSIPRINTSTTIAEEQEEVIVQSGISPAPLSALLPPSPLFSPGLMSSFPSPPQNNKNKNIQEELSIPSRQQRKSSKRRKSPQVNIHSHSSDASTSLNNSKESLLNLPSFSSHRKNHYTPRALPLVPRRKPSEEESATTTTITDDSSTSHSSSSDQEAQETESEERLLPSPSHPHHSRLSPSLLHRSLLPLSHYTPNSSTFSHSTCKRRPKSLTSFRSSDSEGMEFEDAESGSMFSFQQMMAPSPAGLNEEGELQSAISWRTARGSPRWVEADGVSRRRSSKRYSEGKRKSSNGGNDNGGGGKRTRISAAGTSTNRNSVASWSSLVSTKRNSREVPLAAIQSNINTFPISPDILTTSTSSTISLSKKQGKLESIVLAKQMKDYIEKPKEESEKQFDDDGVEESDEDWESAWDGEEESEDIWEDARSVGSEFEEAVGGVGGSNLKRRYSRLKRTNSLSSISSKFSAKSKRRIPPPIQLNWSNKSSGSMGKDAESTSLKYGYSGDIARIVESELVMNDDEEVVEVVGKGLGVSSAGTTISGFSRLEVEIDGPGHSRSSTGGTEVDEKQKDQKPLKSPSFRNFPRREETTSSSTTSKPRSHSQTSIVFPKQPISPSCTFPRQSVYLTKKDRLENYQEGVADFREVLKEKAAEAHRKWSAGEREKELLNLMERERRKSKEARGESGDWGSELVMRRKSLISPGSPGAGRVTGRGGMVVGLEELAEELVKVKVEAVEKEARKVEEVMKDDLSVGVGLGIVTIVEEEKQEGKVVKKQDVQEKGKVEERFNTFNHIMLRSLSQPALTIDYISAQSFQNSDSSNELSSPSPAVISSHSSPPPSSNTSRKYLIRSSSQTTLNSNGKDSTHSKRSSSSLNRGGIQGQEFQFQPKSLILTPSRSSRNPITSSSRRTSATSIGTGDHVGVLNGVNRNSIFSQGSEGRSSKSSAGGHAVDDDDSEGVHSPISSRNHGSSAGEARRVSLIEEKEEEVESEKVDKVSNKLGGDWAFVKITPSSPNSIISSQAFPTSPQESSPPTSPQNREKFSGPFKDEIQIELPKAFSINEEEWRVSVLDALSFGENKDISAKRDERFQSFDSRTGSNGKRSERSWSFKKDAIDKDRKAALDNLGGECNEPSRANAPSTSTPSGSSPSPSGRPKTPSLSVSSSAKPSLQPIPPTQVLPVPPKSIDSVLARSRAESSSSPTSHPSFALPASPKIQTKALPKDSQRVRSRSSIDLRSSIEEIGPSNPHVQLVDLQKILEEGPEASRKYRNQSDFTPPPAATVRSAYSDVDAISREFVNSKRSNRPKIAESPAPAKGKKSKSFLGFSISRKNGNEKIEKAMKTTMKSQTSKPSEVIASGNQVLGMFKLDHIPMPSSPPLSPASPSGPFSPSSPRAMSPDPFRRVVIPPLNLPPSLGADSDLPQLPFTKPRKSEPPPKNL